MVECAYVRSDLTEAAYFATPLRLGVSPYLSGTPVDQRSFSA